MSKVILTMQYEIDEKMREEFLATIRQLQTHYQGNPHISYVVCEQKGKKNSFAEVYTAESEEAYAQFTESEDQTADGLSEKLSTYMKNGKAKYTTYVEIV